MRLTVTTSDGNLYNLEVDPELEVDDLKALIEIESGIRVLEQSLLYDGTELVDQSKTLRDLNIRDHDVLLLRHRVSSSSHQLAQLEQLRSLLLNNPGYFNSLKTRNPQLAHAIESNDPTAFSALLNALHSQADDPTDVESQKRIEEAIRMENVNANMEQALEYTPESFAKVVMLFVDCRVNGHSLKAFVDSGAQATIMSVSCAERCGLGRLVDRRFSGVAKGVGTARIFGRIHMVPIEMAGVFFPCAFTILEDQGMDLLFGLDMLRRHQCSVDLKNNVLRLGDVETPFLAEKDIPKSLRSEEDVAHDSSNSGSVTPRSSGATASNFPVGVPAPEEEKIQTLMNLGFSRSQAIEALRLAKGNVDLAASIMFRQ